MLILPVTAFDPSQRPAFFFNDGHSFPDFHEEQWNDGAGLEKFS